MFNVNFPSPSATTLARGLSAGVAAMATRQKRFTPDFDTIQTAVKDVMTQVAEQVAMPGISTFGGLVSETLQNSPLGGFLGLADSGSTSKPSVGRSSEPKGDQIPGGTSLYKTGQGMYHKGAPGAPDTYAFENTPAGIKFAAEHGYASIDIDMLITKDGVPVATHWAQPMQKDGFHDPLGKLDATTKVKDMTLAEVMRLRNEDGQSQIYPMTTMIKALKDNGIAGDLEAKDDPRFSTDRVMGDLAAQVREAGIPANLKSIDRGSRSDQILKTAQEHGFWVRTAAGNDKKAQEFGWEN